MACRIPPTWEHLIGLRAAEDVGNGMGVRLSWLRALPADYDNQVHYNIYWATTRFDVFVDGPKAVTTDLSVVINRYEPGDLQYFAVRAMEFNNSEFDITRLTQIGVGVYSYPETQHLQEAVNDAYGTIIKVEDNGDFPDFGYLLVGAEIMRYLSKGINEFYIEDVNRGQFGTTIEAHDVDESVKLWYGVEDGNSSIYLQTATWHYTEGSPRNLEALGQLNVDEDGYRAANEDALTTDLTASDVNNIDFPSYDYTGYHRPSLQDTFSGECVNSYVGGEFDGGRGLFFQERNLARLDAMLQVTGEKVILLKRKWTGRRCRCIKLEREHQTTRCPYCYGAGFEGGYDRYINPRPISEYERNVQGFIMTRMQPYTDDLEIVQDQGLRQPSELTAWSLSVPTLKDRDVVVRFNEDGTEEFRYEVLDVVRNKLFFGQTGKQQFRMRRLDKTDIIYQYNAIIQI